MLQLTISSDSTSIYWTYSCDIAALWALWIIFPLGLNRRAIVLLAGHSIINSDYSYCAVLGFIIYPLGLTLQPLAYILALGIGSLVLIFKFPCPWAMGPTGPGPSYISGIYS